MTRSFCIEAAEAPSPVTLRTTASNDDDIEKVLTTREIEDVVYQTVYACQNNVLQVSIKNWQRLTFFNGTCRPYSTKFKITDFDLNSESFKEVSIL